MAKKKSKLANLGLDQKTLDRVYVQAKIVATPYDYSLKDRVVVESPDKYAKITNVLNMRSSTEYDLAEKLGITKLAGTSFRRSPFNIGTKGYLFRDSKGDPLNPYDLDFLMAAAKGNVGYMYKHNNLVVNSLSFREFAETFGVPAAKALIELYVRLYSQDSLTPQLMLTLWEATNGSDLDQVANLKFAKDALGCGMHYIPSTMTLEDLSANTLTEVFYAIMPLTGLSGGKFSYTDPNYKELYAELLRQNYIETAMYLCEIYRAFNEMPEKSREALSMALTQRPTRSIDAEYDPNEAKFMSPEFDVICAAPASLRFDAIRTYVETQLAQNVPDLYSWDGTHSVPSLSLLDSTPILLICNDLHCKSWEDFRVKYFAILLQECKNRGIDLGDLSAADESDASGGGGGGGSDTDDPGDFGDMRMGTKYTGGDDADSGTPGEKAQRNTTPRLETMSNLLKACDTKYDISVDNMPNNMGYKNAYLSLLKPIEFVTRELTKQIREIKTYNSGGKNSGKTRGKLDSHTMYRYKTDPKVFYDTTYKIREMDLAFGIILDQSGSMYGDGVHNGMVSLIMLHHVLTSLRINHAIVGHNSYAYNSVSIKKYVAFNEDPTHTAEVPYMLANLSSSGGNCDSGALNYMEQYIKRTRNKDKIVLIFSDGEPSECDESDLHRQVRKMEREGIHVIGLGIDFDNIKHYYPDNANGKSIAGMVDILVGILKRYVLDKKA